MLRIISVCTQGRPFKLLDLGWPVTPQRFTHGTLPRLARCVKMTTHETIVRLCTG
jgi:hypothetical protein